MEECETRMSSKGQVVIAKPIREQLGLRRNQKFLEEVRGKEIILRPVPKLTELRGSLGHVAKKRSIREISKWIDEGWD